MQMLSSGKLFGHPHGQLVLFADQDLVGGWWRW
jgi:hypothetical protein